MVFNQIASALSVPVDQIVFIACEAFGLILAFIYRFLSTSSPYNSHAYRNVRLLFLTLPGLAMSYACFGHQIVHIISLTCICYGLMVYLPARHVHKYVLAVALIYLSYLHLDRLLNDSLQYAIDITT